jgi:hypothetical protein
MELYQLEPKKAAREKERAPPTSSIKMSKGKKYPKVK